MLLKHEIPILEYDDTQRAVVRPDRPEKLPLPEYAVFPFLGDKVEEFAVEKRLQMIDEFESATKIYPIYKMNYKGKEVCMVQAPVGAAPATQILDYLIGNGVKKVVSSGTCGALLPFAENEFLIPTEALRDEGTSYHYLPPSRTIQMEEKVVAVLERVLQEKGIVYQKCKTWTTDGFFRETKDMVEYRKAEGCAVVEMECSALLACAKFRGIQLGQILFTADTLANVELHDARDWGAESFAPALGLCLDVVVEL